MRRKLKKLNIQATIQQAAGNVGGAFATNMITQKLVPQILGDKSDPKMANMIAFGTGVLLPAVMDSRKMPIINDVAAGIRATAGLQLLQEFVPGIAGIGTANYGVFPFEDRVGAPLGYYDEGEIYDSSVAGAIGAGSPIDMLNSPAAVGSPVF